MKTMNLRLLTGIFAVCIATTSLAETSSEKITSDYNKARSEAVDEVNQKYILMAAEVVKLYLKSGDLDKANETNAWAKKLETTDDKSNTLGLSFELGTTDKL